MEKHTPVLLEESISSLNVRRGGIYVDCTFGSGGHSGRILEVLGGTGKLVSLDSDQLNLQWAEQFSGKNFFFVNGNFANLCFYLKRLGIAKVDGFLFDLGLSSMQINSNRGFSYRHDSPLDMRMDSKSSITAADIVNNSPPDEIANILYHFGQEKKAYRIAKALLESRKKKPIESSQELVKITAGVVGKRVGKAHPSKKTFQALRIRVNEELTNLQAALDSSLSYLSEKGRIVVISYHSLEDRIVKKFFHCKLKEEFFLLYKKPLLPTKEEIARNNRSRSAKLRVLARNSSKDNHSLS